ncbi:MAG: hypothetical protein PVH38_02405 [Gammaproteobacteria bacterium]|jgi:hypothetical protein
MTRPDTYVGVDADINGAMTTIGRIIRDAWVFELLPETENCKGWKRSQIENLLHMVNAEWDKYGCMVSQLPAPVRERHQRIHAAAITRAKAAGWSGEYEIIDEK